MKATELIAELGHCILLWGDREVWLDNDILMKAAAVEVWRESYLDEPAFILIGEDTFELRPLHAANLRAKRLPARKRPTVSRRGRLLAQRSEQVLRIFCAHGLMHARHAQQFSR